MYWWRFRVAQRILCDRVRNKPRKDPRVANEVRVHFLLIRWTPTLEERLRAPRTALAPIRAGQLDLFDARFVPALTQKP